LLFLLDVEITCFQYKEQGLNFKELLKNPSSAS
jgi:hypothetical protein